MVEQSTHNRQVVGSNPTGPKFCCLPAGRQGAKLRMRKKDKNEGRIKASAKYLHFHLLPFQSPQSANYARCCSKFLFNEICLWNYR